MNNGLCDCRCYLLNRWNLVLCDDAMKLYRPLHLSHGKDSTRITSADRWSHVTARPNEYLKDFSFPSSSDSCWSRAVYTRGKSNSLIAFPSLSISLSLTGSGQSLAKAAASSIVNHAMPIALSQNQRYPLRRYHVCLRVTLHAACDNPISRVEDKIFRLRNSSHNPESWIPPARSGDFHNYFVTFVDIHRERI